MLVINLDNVKPSYLVSAVDNKNVDVVRFYANSFASFYTKGDKISVKLLSDETDYVTEFELSSSDIHYSSVNKTLYADWTMSFDATPSHRIKVQFCLTKENEKTKNSKIIELVLESSIQVDEEIEHREPTVIQKLKEEVAKNTYDIQNLEKAQLKTYYDNNKVKDILGEEGAVEGRKIKFFIDSEADGCTYLCQLHINGGEWYIYGVGIDCSGWFSYNDSGLNVTVADIMVGADFRYSADEIYVRNMINNGHLIHTIDYEDFGGNAPTVEQVYNRYPRQYIQIAKEVLIFIRIDGSTDPNQKWITIVKLPSEDTSSENYIDRRLVSNDLNWELVLDDSEVAHEDGNNTFLVANGSSAEGKTTQKISNDIEPKTSGDVSIGSKTKRLKEIYSNSIRTLRLGSPTGNNDFDVNDVVLSDNFAPNHGSSVTYYFGDYCFNNHILYRCIVNSTTGTFNEDDWEVVSVMGETNRKPNIYTLPFMDNGWNTIKEWIDEDNEHIYDRNDNDITNDILNGDYDNYVLDNDLLKSNNDLVLLNTNHYLFLIGRNERCYAMEINSGSFKRGDMILLGTSQYPNRYCLFSNNNSFAKLGVSQSELDNKLNKTVVTDEYDNTRTYAVGDLCIHDNTLQKCNTPITVAEEWNSAHWTTITIADAFFNLDRDNTISAGRKIVLGDVNSYHTEITQNGLNLEFKYYNGSSLIGTSLGLFGKNSHLNNVNVFDFASDDTTDIGSSSKRARNLYLSGGVNPNTNGYKVVFPDTTNFTADVMLATTTFASNQALKRNNLQLKVDLTVSSIKNQYYKHYLFNVQTGCFDVNIHDEVMNGDYDNINVKNNLFNSNDDSITLTPTSSADEGYFIFTISVDGTVGYGFMPVPRSGVLLLPNTIILIDGDVAPSRYYAGSGEAIRIGGTSGFNVVKVSEMTDSTHFTQDQITIINNGKPTRIIGALGNNQLKNVVFLSCNDNGSSLSVLLAYANSNTDKGLSYVDITKADGFVNIHNNRIKFGTNEIFLSTDNGGVNSIYFNGKKLPNHATDLTKDYELNQEKATGNLVWKEKKHLYRHIGTVQDVNGHDWVFMALTSRSIPYDGDLIDFLNDARDFGMCLKFKCQDNDVENYVNIVDFADNLATISCYGFNIANGEFSFDFGSSDTITTTVTEVL